jgi:hypothetical protein
MKAVALIPGPLLDAAMVQIARVALKNPGDDPPGHAIHAPAGKGERTVLAQR